jgi:hypothetical protein
MTATINSFNIGTDLLALTIVDNATGQTVSLDGKKDMWEAQADDDLIKSTPIDNGGLPDHRVVANGWSGTIRVDRANGNFGAYYALLEQNFYSNGVQHYCTVTATIQNASGTGVERMQYQNVVFHGYKPGSFEKMTKTQSEVAFACQQRVQL